MKLISLAIAGSLVLAGSATAITPDESLTTKQYEAICAEHGQASPICFRAEEYWIDCGTDLIEIPHWCTPWSEYWATHPENPATPGVAPPPAPTAQGTCATMSTWIDEQRIRNRQQIVKLQAINVKLRNQLRLERAR